MAVGRRLGKPEGAWLRLVLSALASLAAFFVSAASGTLIPDALNPAARVWLLLLFLVLAASAAIADLRAAA